MVRVRGWGVRVGVGLMVSSPQFKVLRPKIVHCLHMNMGIRTSKEKKQSAYALLPDNRYRVLYKIHNEVIRFNPKQSYAICIGIDRQEGTPERSLGPLVVSDCKSLAEACSTSLRIPSAHVKQLVASEDPGCLFMRAGLSKLLVECARSVGEEGILVITFSGHGTTVVRDGTEQAVLALIGHTTERPDCLDGKDISQSVQTTAKFRGKKVLLVLDCCFSGGIAEWLQYNERAGEIFRTIAACSPYQTSIQLEPLDHSIFTYFLLDALRGSQAISESCQVEQREMNGPMVSLSLQDIFVHICDSSWALSAMYIKYDKASQSLHGCTMTPVVTSKLEQSRSEENMLDAVEMTDGPYEGSNGEERLQFLQKHWKAFPRVQASERWLPQNSYKWLREQAKPDGPLAMLEKRGHLAGKVLQATICALSNSVASIHLYEKHPWNGRARLFIIDMTEILSVVESAVSDGEQVMVRHKAVREALTYYFAVYKSVEWPDRSELRSLYRMLADEEESTDGLVSAEEPCIHIHMCTHTYTILSIM